MDSGTRFKRYPVKWLFSVHLLAPESFSAWSGEGFLLVDIVGCKSAALFIPGMRAGSLQSRTAEIPVQNDSAFRQFYANAQLS